MRFAVISADKCHTRQGFTLVELIVVMAVFMTVLVISAQIFGTVVTEAKKIAKSEEGNIEGVIGLEVMRHDLEQAGFGLPWGFTAAPSYSEADTGNWSDADRYAKLNDSAASPPVPRAIVGFDSFADSGSTRFGDFIAVKGSTVGRTKASQLWTYIPYHNYSAAPVWQSRPVSWPSGNLATSDRVIAVRNNFNNSDDDHLLVTDNAGKFEIPYSSTPDTSSFYLPTDSLQTHMIYGISGSDTTLRMPFNRADYFVKIPANTAYMPSFCAQGAGVLYKATVNHGDGKFTYIPLVDCVANMQVVLGWSLNSGTGTGQDSVHVYSSLSNTDYSFVQYASAGNAALPASTAADIAGWLNDPKSIREHLKVIKVYLLVQEGRRDENYTYPLGSILVGDQVADGSANVTQTYNFSAEQRKYRWKLYKMVVRPKNLVSNQR